MRHDHDYPLIDTSLGDRYSPPGLDRLTHLVLVDGRLVDFWSEPVEDSRWQRYADEFDRRKRPDPVPTTPPRPPYDVMLDWLANVVGGQRALDELTGEPLSPDGLELPVAQLDLRARHRLESSAALLDTAAERCFDEETGIALRRGLLLAWSAEPQAVLRGASAAHTAAGVLWAVGKANGLYGPAGVITQARVREALGLTSPLSGPGPGIQRALQGFLPRDVRSPGTGPDLLPLGHPELLTSSTRQLLVRLRDRARAAKGDHEDRAALLP